MSESTKGEKIAWQFRPFCTHPPKTKKDLDLSISGLAEAIDETINKESLPYKEVVVRINQLLGAIEYEKLSDYQAKVVLLLEERLKSLDKNT